MVKSKWYIKKPREVEAIQVSFNKIDEVKEFYGNPNGVKEILPSGEVILEDGSVLCNVGDYLVKHYNSIEVVLESDFEEQYECVFCGWPQEK